MKRVSCVNLKALSVLQLNWSMWNVTHHLNPISQSSLKASACYKQSLLGWPTTSERPVHPPPHTPVWHQNRVHFCEFQNRQIQQSFSIFMCTYERNTANTFEGEIAPKVPPLSPFVRFMRESLKKNPRIFRKILKRWWDEARSGL